MNHRDAKTQRKVLIISYYFPPSGGPGVQRVLKFVKYLPGFGWEPVVLTVGEGDFPARDESLMAELPLNLQVYRTKILEPYTIYRKLAGIKKGQAIDVENIPASGTKRGLKSRLFEFVRSNFFIPDARRGWRRFAVKKAAEIIQDQRIKLIYSSSPPYTCSVVARDIRRRLDVKWVAGFRDPWTGFLNTPRRKGIAKKIDAAFEHSCMKEADLIEVAWEGIKEDILNKYGDIPEKKILCLPNGFDPEDFERHPPGPLQKRKEDKFTVAYTGSMYGVRNPDSFLKALHKLYYDGKIKPENLSLIFAGRFSKEVRTMLEGGVFKNSTEIIEYVSHARAIEYMLDSDALLLVIDNTKDVARIIPGKLYEYLGARKPVIAIGDRDSDAAKVLSECGSGKIAPHDDIEGIANIILKYYEDWKKSETDTRFNDECINQYSRKTITGKLAELFERAVGG